MTPQPAAQASAELTLAELAPHARARLRSWRNTKLGFAILFLSLGVLGLGVLALAAPLADLLMLGAVFFVVAIVPGLGFLASGWRSVERHPLLIALEQRPDTVRAVRYAYLERLTGYAKIATITLADGTAHGIEIR